MDWATLGAVLLVPFGRSVAGWLKSSLEDGKVDKFEIGLLGSTLVRVGIIAVGTYYGLNGLGIDVSALGAAAGATVLDIIVEAIKKIGKK
jgi:small-conductance mechanosensitive channel